MTEQLTQRSPSFGSPGFTPPTRFAVPGRIAVSERAASVWQTATLTEIRRETPHAATFRLGVPDWEGHLPGQHLMLRLTAPDGYAAQRHYSNASAPDDPAPEAGQAQRARSHDRSEADRLDGDFPWLSPGRHTPG